MGDTIIYFTSLETISFKQDRRKTRYLCPTISSLRFIYHYFDKMSIWDGQLINKNKEDVDAKAIIDGAEVVAVYFSAHWCPPCRGFTPVLKTFYEENKAGGLVIIFVSSDRTEDDMLSYFTNDHGEYYAVKHSSSLGKTLKDNCGVSGIPMLAIVKKDGTLLHNGGRADVTNNSSGALDSWKKKY